MTEHRLRTILDQSRAAFAAWQEGTGTWAAFLKADHAYYLGRVEWQRVNGGEDAAVKGGTASPANGTAVSGV